MAGVRKGARAVLRYYVPLLFVAVIAQILLAGEGIFGIKGGPKLDDQKTLDPHRALGFILTEPAALLLLICALPFLIFLQAPLSWAAAGAGCSIP